MVIDLLPFNSVPLVWLWFEAMHTLTYLITIQFQITPLIVSRVNFLCFPFVGLKIDLDWERTSE